MKGQIGMRRGRRAGARGAVAAASFALVLAGIAQPAFGNHFAGATGGTGCDFLNMQDNSSMYYNRSNLTTKMQNGVADTLANDVNPTDMTTTEEAVNPGTDVIYYDNDYDTYCNFDWHPDGPDEGTDSVIGHAECVALSGSACEKFQIRLVKPRGVVFDAARVILRRG